MRMKILLPAALLLCAVLAAPAQADYIVGMGDQKPQMFDSPAFQALGVKRVRFLVPYDWYKHQGNENEVIGFMNRAQAARADVFVHFTARRGCFRSGRYSRAKACRAPSVKAYMSAFNRFRREYPFVRTFGVWNEGNHVSQPVARNPRRAAQYFLAARKACRGCTLVAADVLDISNMRPWLRRFLGAAKGKARIFGLHNYQDVNRRTASGTRALLATVPGQVWLTETGGILKFLPAFKRSQKRQANRTKYMFRLADRYDRRLSGLRSRITRLYNYQWTGVERSARFDAGLVNPNGSGRKAYRTFKKIAKRYDR